MGPFSPNAAAVDEDLTPGIVCPTAGGSGELPKNRTRAGQGNKSASPNYIVWRSPDGAVSWDDALDDAITRLEADPNIYGEIPDLVNSRDKYQQVFFKTRYGDRYRAVYVVDGEHVTVLRIRGKGQRPLGTKDLPNG